MSPTKPIHSFDRLAGLPVPAAFGAQQAMIALQGGEPARALRELDRLGPPAREHAEILRLRGLALMRLGDAGAAIASLSEAVERWPDDAMTCGQLGAVLAATGDLDGAVTLLRRAVALDPDHYEGWFNLGHALQRLDDARGACDAFGEALRLAPEQADVRVQHAEMLKRIGRLDQAEAQLRQVLASDPDSISAWVGLSTLKTFRPDEAELDRLLALHASGGVPEARRVDFAFALADLLERAGRYEQAHPMFVAANAAKRRSLRWNAAAVSALVDDILARFARLGPVADAAFGSEAIFIVGMPRSGSTLLEQILSAHPDVQGGGERNEVVEVLQAESMRRGQRFPVWVDEASDADWRRLGEDLLRRCGGWRDARARFTNKTLGNWQTLGAIRRMLPGARFIHCRRDPLEMVWSAFKHHFGDAQMFTYDLDELLAYHADCERAMRAWKAQSPGVIHDFVHEDLLADPEARIRALLDHCGLAFSPSCLAFHENERAVDTLSASQVRQPIRRDLAVARRYGPLLDPLRERLALASRQA